MNSGRGGVGRRMPCNFQISLCWFREDYELQQMLLSGCRHAPLGTTCFRDASHSCSNCVFSSGACILPHALHYCASTCDCHLSNGSQQRWALHRQHHQFSGCVTSVTPRVMAVASWQPRPTKSFLMTSFLTPLPR